MRKLLIPLIALTLSLHVADSGADDSQFDFGVLGCVAELRRNAPSLPPSIQLEDADMLMRSSAFVLGDPDGPKRVFLITAAHNIFDCESVDVYSGLLRINAIHRSVITEQLKPLFYVDQAEDLAVFEWSDSQADFFRRTDKARLETKEGKRTSTYGRVVATLVEPKDRVDRRLPRGGIAAAAGTITQGAAAAKYPAYSCTISRYVNGDELLSALNEGYRSAFSSNSTEGTTQFRHAVVQRIIRQQFLVVESMSITVGFSGSPIMVSDDYFLDKGQVVGIVIGGKATDVVGRSAWAITADTIGAAIKKVKAANDGALSRWRDLLPTSDPGLAVEDPTARGRWIAKLDGIPTLRQKLGEQFTTPFLVRFNNESRVEFIAKSKNTPMCKDRFLSMTSKLTGKSFTFRGFAFDETCMDTLTLLMPHFVDCDFRATRFRGAVLTGPVFERCSLFDQKSRPIDIRHVLTQPCNSPVSICSPAAIVAASFIDDQGREIIKALPPLTTDDSSPR